MEEHKKQTSLSPHFSICVYLSVNVSSFVPPLPVALRIVYI